MIKFRDYLTISFTTKTKIDLQVYSSTSVFEDGSSMGIYCSVFNGSVQDFQSQFEAKIYDQYLDWIVVRHTAINKAIMQICIRPSEVQQCPPVKH